MNRFRRLRKNETIRRLVGETRLSKDQLIQPFFVIEGRNRQETISSMPGIYRYSVDLLLKALEGYQKSGGRAGLFFGIPLSHKKNLKGTQAYSPDGIIQKAVFAIKKEFPDFFVITDVCLCGYMSHGHCGVVEKNRVDNDKTLSILGKIAVSHAQAGSDMVAPSDMMDLRVHYIRQELERNGFQDIPIMSYAAKYASSFYGPFRDALDSTPQFGDRKTYQMDYANRREALKEARQDLKEGADIILVKPALAYLDVISLLRDQTAAPIAAYSVSGEYAMIKAGARLKWINERDIVLETLTAIKRAGADLIITYHTGDVLQWL